MDQIASRGEVELVQEIHGNRKYVYVKAPNKPANVTIDSDALEYLYLCWDIVDKIKFKYIVDRIDHVLTINSECV